MAHHVSKVGLYFNRMAKALDEAMQVAKVPHWIDLDIKKEFCLGAW